MALTNFFLSIGSAKNETDMQDNRFTAGTSSTSTDHIELRMMTDDGAAGATGLTRFQVIKALEEFVRWIKNGGEKGAGANLPVL